MNVLVVDITHDDKKAFVINVHVPNEEKEKRELRYRDAVNEIQERYFIG